MKKLMLFILIISSFAVNAETITILETRIARGFDWVDADSKFHMDTTTGQGYVDVTATEYERDVLPPRQRCDRWGCYPAPNPIPRVWTIFQDRVEVANLKLVNNEMIYSLPDRDVNCGKLGTSRVLRRPTLYLTGDCKLTEKLNYDQLIVTLTLK